MTDLDALNGLIAKLENDPKISSQRLLYLMQTLGEKRLFLSDEWNDIVKSLRYLLNNSGGGGGGGSIDPEDYDLEDFNNASTNPYLRESDLSNAQKRQMTFSQGFYFHPSSGTDNIWHGRNYNGTIGAQGGLNCNLSLGTTDISLIRNNGLSAIFTAPYNCKVVNVFIDTLFGRQNIIEFGLIKYKRLNGGSSDTNIAINNLPVGVFPVNGGNTQGNITAHQDNYVVTTSPTIAQGEQLIPVMRRLSGNLLAYIGYINVTIEEI